jgi:dipeptidyl aminopeptidase/acylaminoacyl peptidase
MEAPKLMNRFLFAAPLAACFFAAFQPTAGNEDRPMTVEDLLAVKRIADPQASPDGRKIVYVVTDVDLAANSTRSSLWIADANAPGNGRPLTNAGKKDAHPRWSPDGKRVLFQSNRSGSMQLWVIDVDGGEARKLTDVSTDASNGLWSRDGRRIAFVSTVRPEFSAKPFAESDRLNKEKDEAVSKSPVKAKVFTKLFYRHWDSHVDDKRQHLFVMSFDPATGAAGEPKNVTPGDRDAYPTSSTFSVGDDFTFSPDGSHLVFTAVPEKNEAWNTNMDLCRVPVAGSSTWENLTAANPAADGAPVFSPDGSQLVWRSQKRPGFEADKWNLMVADVDPSGKPTGEPRVLTKSLDRSVEGIAVEGKGASAIALFTAEEDGRILLWQAPLSGEAPSKLVGPKGSVAAFSAAGGTTALLHAAMASPAEVSAMKGGAVQPVTSWNAASVAKLKLPVPESIKVPGAGGTPMQMWVLKPPGFDPAKKWPLIYLVHGGPQSAWLDNWSARWNPQVWAAKGYVVAMPNPRGSTGFGQKYVDEISGDWGGKVYEDLMAGVAHLEKQPWIDADRMASAGASYGGYMMNWFQGNTTKFKTLVTHCGVYNHESMYATTEELWFDEWEHGAGKPLWEAREEYRKHSPHLKAANFKTPMLIIHNDLDFRVPVSEGHQLFTTLQRLGVRSKFINFPDEGHWVLKPANSKFWHDEIFAWIGEFCPPGGQ